MPSETMYGRRGLRSYTIESLVRGIRKRYQTYGIRMSSMNQTAPVSAHVRKNISSPARSRWHASGRSRYKRPDNT